MGQDQLLRLCSHCSVRPTWMMVLVEDDIDSLAASLKGNKADTVLAAPLRLHLVRQVAVVDHDLKLALPCLGHVNCTYRTVRC